MFKIKVILLGEARVGKTAIINQYIRCSFEEWSWATSTPKHSTKEIDIYGKPLHLEIWDTSGAESYRAVNKIYMRNIDIALLIYDITDRRSFEELNYWIHYVKERNNKEVLFGVVGNKNDLYEKRDIDEEEGMKFAKNNNILFFETSAKDYDSVENVFLRSAQEYLRKLEKEVNLKKGYTYLKK